MWKKVPIFFLVIEPNPKPIIQWMKHVIAINPNRRGNNTLRLSTASTLFWANIPYSSLLEHTIVCKSIAQKSYRNKWDLQYEPLKITKFFSNSTTMEKNWKYKKSIFIKQKKIVIVINSSLESDHQRFVLKWNGRLFVSCFSILIFGCSRHGSISERIFFIFSLDSKK